jgi:hypothetical protein
VILILVSVIKILSALIEILVPMMEMKYPIMEIIASSNSNSNLMMEITFPITEI